MALSDQLNRLAASAKEAQDRAAVARARTARISSRTLRKPVRRLRLRLTSCGRAADERRGKL